MSQYKDKLDANQQITVEEKIASMIFDHESTSQDTDGGIYGFPEEECAQLGRDILLQVLSEFRPDLIASESEPADPDLLAALRLGLRYADQTACDDTGDDDPHPVCEQARADCRVIEAAIAKATGEVTDLLECSICGDELTAEADLRNHLAEHHGAAHNMNEGQMRDQFRSKD